MINFHYFIPFSYNPAADILLFLWIFFLFFYSVALTIHAFCAHPTMKKDTLEAVLLQYSCKRRKWVPQWNHNRKINFKRHFDIKLQTCCTYAIRTFKFLYCLTCHGCVQADREEGPKIQDSLKQRWTQNKQLYFRLQSKQKTNCTAGK